MTIASTHAEHAAEIWRGYHYRNHRGEFEDCDSPVCRQALDILIREES